MVNNIKAIPEGYYTVTPYLTIKNADQAIEFYKRAFDAKEIGRLTAPDGSVGHAELQIGDSRILLAEESIEQGRKGPQTLGGSPVSICLYVENVDVVFKKAIAAGGKTYEGMEVKEQFYGDRSGSLTDPFGHKWTIGTHKEDVAFEEMQKRFEEMVAQQKVNM
ncbi:MAG: VOC family protein [Bacteroidetes bacterium]|nr:VOC family protein [Bacteroidota bacterium]